MPTAGVRVSVVIPTYRRADLVVGCLEALARQEATPAPVEVIVVDDGSPDDTEARVRAMIPRFPLPLACIRKENGGAASARNAGVRVARGEWIAFLDDDCVPPPTWLGRVLAAIERSPEAAGIGGYVEPMGLDNLLSRYVHACRLLEGPAVAEGRVASLITANALFRKADLERIGGFDERFRAAGGEDVDLSYRLRAAGRVLAADRTLVVLHHHRAEVRPFLKSFYQYGRGSGVLARKLGVEARGWRAFLRRVVAFAYVAAAPAYAGHHAVRGVGLRDALAFGTLDGLRKAAYALGKASGLRPEPPEPPAGGAPSGAAS